MIIIYVFNHNINVVCIVCLFFHSYVCVKFSTLLFLLLCAEVTVGVLAFVYRGKAKEITEQQLRASMKDYYKRGEVNPAKQAWDFVQKQVQSQQTMN